MELEGRRFWNSGLANNLPVDRAFAEGTDSPVVVASDLHAPDGAPPGSLDGSNLPAQILVLAVQAWTWEAPRRERDLLPPIEPGAPPAILLHLMHRPPADQRALKALDYSGTAIEGRVGHGREDLEAMLARPTSASRSEPLDC